jgi:hypothetical protein
MPFEPRGGKTSWHTIPIQHRRFDEPSKCPSTLLFQIDAAVRSRRTDQKNAPDRFPFSFPCEVACEILRSAAESECQRPLGYAPQSTRDPRSLVGETVVPNELLLTSSAARDGSILRGRKNSEFWEIEYDFVLAVRGQLEEQALSCDVDFGGSGHPLRA